MAGLVTVVHLEVLVEEPSAEATLNVLLPRIVPRVGFGVRPYEGRPDLLRKLPRRLAGYAKLARVSGLRLVVLVDRDDDDCRELKARLEAAAGDAGLPTLSAVRDGVPPLMATRIACEELEAWFLGDVAALVAAFPGVPRSLSAQPRFRDPDAVVGGTWQAFERVLQQHGHHTAGLRKVEAAQQVAVHMDVENNRSSSFNAFRDGVRRLVGGEH